MTREEFKEYIEGKAAAVQERLASGPLPLEELRSLRYQERLLGEVKRIIGNGTGPEVRRLQREYERRLGRLKARRRPLPPSTP